jgi:hypothetical protein
MMTHRCPSRFAAWALGLSAAVAPHVGFAQSGSQGSVVVTVDDATKALVPDATLTLISLRTNDTRVAKSGAKGTYTFVNLPIGEYKLLIAKPGYATKIVDSIVVASSETKSVDAALTVGSSTETVDVASSTSVIESSSNALATVIDIKQIEDLPLYGRDLSSLATLVPGYAGNPGAGSTTGSFNGQGLTNQGSNIDGTVGSPERGKYNGNIEPSVQPRIEDIEQMSVVTDQLDLNSGFGQATTQLNFVSRSGSNHFHGRAYFDYRDSALFANDWSNNAVGNPKAKERYLDYGVSVGGPIWRDKLFFFGTYATLKVPGSSSTSDTFIASSAQNGNFLFNSGSGGSGTQSSVNVLSLAQQQNAALSGSVNSVIAKQLTVINSAVQGNSVSVTSGDPNLDTVAWNYGNAQTNYYPAGRIDYHLNDKARMYLAFLMTYTNAPTGEGSGPFPGPGFTNQEIGYKVKNYTSNYGFDYIFSPKLLNQFKAGFLYDSTIYGDGLANLYATEPFVTWAYGSSGQTYPTPVGNYYPLFNLSDSMTWQHGAHTVTYGLSWYREQDHYYNPPVGFTQYSLGVAGGDTAVTSAISQQTIEAATGVTPTPAQVGAARNLYATLTGRISSAYGQTAYEKSTNSYSHPNVTTKYDLDELTSAYGLFVQDAWKVRPNLTLNYGLRWDFVGDDYDLTGAYHSSTEAAIYGPTAIGALFQPGTLGGDLNPEYTTQPKAYNPWKLTPQPAFGFAYSLNDKTVIRGGYALRRYTEPSQFFWDNSTSYGSFFYQSFSATAAAGGGAGTFAPGSQTLGTPFTAQFVDTPPNYLTSEAQSDFTFNPSAPPVTGIDQHIKQPYVQSWNLGVQRSLTKSLAIEVRYNGNRTIHQWIAVDPNEVNVFENGFLSEFKNAQANLAANPNCSLSNQNPSAPCSFSSSFGHATPILDAALGGQNGAGYQDQSLITNVRTGQVGNVAQLLDGIFYDNSTYFCNLVGASFGPCANNLGYTGAGAGYPINFFQANPYAGGNTTSYLTAAGYSNYNGLQIDLRQGNWHGLQYDTNYTWSKSLGVTSKQTYSATFNGYSVRNIGLSYVPSQFDLRNVLHANGTYDLPFGKGKAFLSYNNGIVDRIVGHWNVGTIIGFQSGAPFVLNGENYTYNDYADGGVALTGVTPKQLQQSIRARHIPGTASVSLLDPKYISASGAANNAYISPNTTPGTFAQIFALHGPHAFNQDLAVTKAIPIFREINFNLQGEFLNVWNHPTFGNTSFSQDAGVQDGSFAQSGLTNANPNGYGRILEIRGNINF